MCMRWLILLSCLVFKTSCFCITPSALQQFIQEYNSSPERQYRWSKAIYAIEKGNDDIALFYIEKEGIGDVIYNSGNTSDHNNRNSIHQRNVLITCVRQNKFEIIHAILQSKSPPKIDAVEYWLVFDRPTDNRRRPTKEKRILNIAIEECSNSLEAVKMLLDYGADINLRESHGHGRTPLETAISTKKYDIAKYLVEKGAVFTGILPAVIQYGDLDLLEFFLQRKIPPNEGLESAVRWRNKEALILLLDYDANPLWMLDLAVQLGDQEIIDILMNAIFKNQAEIKN
jgi:ankyrin repeat protein